MDEKLIRTDDMTWISYPSLEKTNCVEHGFSTREKGVSSGIYASMNLSYTRGDDTIKVTENFRRFCNAVHIDYTRLVSTHQTHTANVVQVTSSDCGNGITKPQKFKDVDGLITNVPEVGLVTYHADCVPLFFVDPVSKAIGLSHSGWRGTVQKIGAVTVRKMEEAFGSRPENIVAAIGPSICKSCYEVSEDVANAFYKAFSEEDCRFILEEKDGGKFQLDLWEANRRILNQAGIPFSNITVTKFCTHCQPELLWSHRTLGSDRGSLAAFLCLKKA